MGSDLPCAVEGLDVNEVKDGLIVYDVGRDRVHYLNATAAIVFTLCDGTRGSATMAGLFAEAYGLDAPPLGEVEQCLAQLRDEGLVR